MKTCQINNLNKKKKLQIQKTYKSKKITNPKKLQKKIRKKYKKKKKKKIQKNYKKNYRKNYKKNFALKTKLFFFFKLRHFF